MSQPRTFLDGRVTLHAGDCRDVLREMVDNSVDSVVTDPPYHLTSIVKRFGGDNSKTVKSNLEQPADKNLEVINAGAFRRLTKGFMGKQWDGGDIAFQPELWAEVLRVLKPGGYIMAFSGCRTYHRMACAIEDAGFITHPFFAWATGQGFPKAHSLKNQLHGKICDCERTETISKRDLRSVQCADVSSAVCIEEEREEVLFDGMPEPYLQDHRKAPRNWNGWGNEPSMEGGCNISESTWQLREREICSMPPGANIDGTYGRICDGASISDGKMVPEASNSNRMRPPRRSQPAEQFPEELIALAGQQEPQERGAWPLCDRCGKQIIDADGWFYGTQSCKPAIEPVYFGQKPFERGLNGAQNVLKWGTGAINVGACKIPSGDDLTRDCFGLASAENEGWRRPWMEGVQKQTFGSTDGRWPANLLHDNSPEVMACFPETTSGDNGGGSQRTGLRGNSAPPNEQFERNGDSGSAARFFASFPQEDVQRIFYTSKAGADDRLGSKHPTVKPLDLIQYFVRLITPKNGVCLDLFAGTGTTGEAAFREGFRSILIEREAEYIADIERRMSLVMEGPVTRAHAGMKARGRPRDDGPLFGGSEADDAARSKYGRDGQACKFNLTNSTFGGVAAKPESAE